MSAISFDVQLHDAEARDRLDDLIARIDQRRAFHAEVGQLLADSTRARFRTQKDPTGAAWAPLKPATIKGRTRRRRSALSILRETGALAGSIRFEAGDDSVRVGSVLEDYAAIHQLGGIIDMPARKQELRFRKAKTGAGRRFAKKNAKAIATQTVDRKAHKVTIPARPYLGISTEDQADIFEAAGRWLGL